MQTPLIRDSTALDAVPLADLIAVTPHGIASRVLSKHAGGTVTLFAFDAGESLSEHSTPLEALAVVLDGSLRLTVGGHVVDALPGTVTRLPANVPHAVDATMASRMLLIMLRSSGSTG